MVIKSAYMRKPANRNGGRPRTVRVRATKRVAVWTTRARGEARVVGGAALTGAASRRGGGGAGHDGQAGISAESGKSSEVRQGTATGAACCTAAHVRKVLRNCTAMCRARSYRGSAP